MFMKERLEFVCDDYSSSYFELVMAKKALREKCANTELFLVRIFPHLDTFHTKRTYYSSA